MKSLVTCTVVVKHGTALLFEPAAKDGVPQTAVAGPALVMHPAIDDRLDPRSPLWTPHHRLGGCSVASAPPESREMR